MPINPTCTLAVKTQQLCARELLAHHDLAAHVKPDEMKNCFTKINADGV